MICLSAHRPPKLLLSLAAAAMLLLAPGAAADPGFDPNDFGPSPGQCDFSDIKHSLYETESGGSDERAYTIVGPQTKYGRPLGKYQFIPPTQETMINRNPQCGGDACRGQKLLERQCWPVQECLMDALLAENLDRVRNDSACQAALGKTVTGCNNQGCMTCTVTESGLLAAMHLGGPKACAALASGAQGPSDNLGTSVGYYACRHGGLAVPGQCTPAPYDPATAPPTLTWTQYETMVELGEDESINISSIQNNWVASLMLMAEQFTANMAQQIQGIGKLLDAKHQLETQAVIQKRTAQAHKDYQPSEQMCTFGTFSRDLAATQRQADLTQRALAEYTLGREIGSGDAKGMTGATDSLSRLKQFREHFCNPADNGNGLELLCPTAAPAHMQNRDIDYTQTIDAPLSLDINLSDNEVTDDERAVFALIDNLFLHAPLPRIPEGALERQRFQYHYMNLRSIAAIRGVARNSLAAIVALKTASPQEADSAAPYLKALMREMGVEDAEIEKVLGEHPSYHAQMEFLTKTLYQNPSFYTNLYDKPVNIERIRAAMRAIKLMHDRDIHDAMTRREMLLSMLLELRLRESAQTVYGATERALFASD